MSISTTASHAAEFLMLPRRETGGVAMSSFMINDEVLLVQVLKKFDVVAVTIFIDVEPKQEINLMEHAINYVKSARILSYKPNDTTPKSCDMLLRHKFGEDLEG